MQMTRKSVGSSRPASADSNSAAINSTGRNGAARAMPA
jgi:hypothetical protein